MNAMNRIAADSSTFFEHPLDNPAISEEPSRSTRQARERSSSTPAACMAAPGEAPTAKGVDAAPGRRVPSARFDKTESKESLQSLKAGIAALGQGLATVAEDALDPLIVDLLSPHLKRLSSSDASALRDALPELPGAGGRVAPKAATPETDRSNHLHCAIAAAIKAHLDAHALFETESHLYQTVRQAVVRAQGQPLGKDDMDRIASAQGERLSVMLEMNRPVAAPAPSLARVTAIVDAVMSA
jgi:hypothetical protein